MIKFFTLLSLVCTLSFPAIAQETNDKTTSDNTQVTVDDYEQRLTLAREMHEIWPTRPKIESVLDNVVQRAPAQERLRIKAALRKAIKFDALDEASIDSMAEIFTIKELQAMISFYGSKEGRSVSFKTDDYEKSLQPILSKMMDKALLDIKLGTPQ